MSCVRHAGMTNVSLYSKVREQLLEAEVGSRERVLSLVKLRQDWLGATVEQNDRENFSMSGTNSIFSLPVETFSKGCLFFTFVWIPTIDFEEPTVRMRRGQFEEPPGKLRRFLMWIWQVSCFTAVTQSIRRCSRISMQWTGRLAWKSSVYRRWYTLLNVIIPKKSVVGEKLTMSRFCCVCPCTFHTCLSFKNKNISNVTKHFIGHPWYLEDELSEICNSFWRWMTSWRISWVHPAVSVCLHRID